MAQGNFYSLYQKASVETEKNDRGRGNEADERERERERERESTLLSVEVKIFFFLKSRWCKMLAAKVATLKDLMDLLLPLYRGSWSLTRCVSACLYVICMFLLVYVIIFAHKAFQPTSETVAAH